jgi:gliding motility-associated-like protein
LIQKLPFSLLLFFIALLQANAQEVTLYEQFNGRYDYHAIGNTLNLQENNTTSICQILTTSSATLNLENNQNVVAAYLYWAGSGTGDLEINLNDVTITAERTFDYVLITGGLTLPFFAAFSDITDFVQNTGNGDYTISEFDLTDVIEPYCINSTNFGGWSIILIYEDPDLPINQINVYDGLEGVHSTQNAVNIVLENLMIASTEGAKIGFLAWEGDSQLAINETLQVNGNILSNPPLNPSTNLFNSTNSFTQSNQLWNMDLDFFNIENYIQAGDTSIDILLTSGNGSVGDFIMLNNLVVVVNSQLPDATITIDELYVGENCGNRSIEVDFTVHNLNSTAPLSEATPIAFYANDILIGSAETLEEIPINDSESQQIILEIPEEIPNEFLLRIAVDDIGDGTGIIPEINEGNNEDEIEVTLLVFPEISELPNQEICQTVGEQFFNLTLSTEDIDPDYYISFHESEYDAENNLNPITNPQDYEPINNPQTIFVRVDNGACFIIESFVIEIIVCPLPDATISIDNELFPCRQRNLLIAYTVYNTNGTAVLPSNTPIAFYVNEELVATDHTRKKIIEGGYLSQQIEISIPDWVPDTFELMLSVDDIGNGTGIVEELDETNNTDTQTVAFGSIEDLPQLPDLTECNEGFGFATFDLTQQYEWIPSASQGEIAFYTSYDDALSEVNAVWNPENFQSNTNPQTLFIRLDTEVCFAIGDFKVGTEDCPPKIPQGFSPNGDQTNDCFKIIGLLDVYPNHEIRIYTRNGNLIFIGNNETGLWNGTANHGLLYEGAVPTGLYFYSLDLKHPDYSIFTGWVYLNK